jgi:GNAT superfamily N-acetyltransferase
VPPAASGIRFSTRRKPSAAALSRLYSTAWWTKGRGPQGVKAVLRHSDLFATAWAGGRLIAFARVSTDFAYRAVLWDVIVDGSHQRRGLGGRLVRSILADKRLAGVESFWLFTTDKQPFYSSLGFKTYPRNVMLWRRHIPGRGPAR